MIEIFSAVQLEIFLCLKKYFNFRSGRSEPAGRGLCQRAASAGLREEEDRGAGSHGSPALRHLPPAPGVPRLRLQDPHQVLRDRLHQAGLHWRN